MCVCVCVCSVRTKDSILAMSSGGKVNLEINDLRSVCSCVEFARLSKTVMFFVFSVLAGSERGLKLAL